MYLNKVFLIGNLTRDPELKALPSGSKVCNFAVATNRVFKDKEGNKQEVTEFHNIVAFNRLAELVGQYMKKGRQVYVEGRLQTRSWDGQDGQKRYRTEIVADTVQFGSQGGGAGTSRSSSSSSPTTAGEPAVAGGSTPAKDGGAPDSGEKIAYPQEEINPDDIPF